jgi:pyruvate/2-oxoglutarate dehydrogenase complex dihydrolipoamide dehydrogenase (E3) component
MARAASINALSPRRLRRRFRASVIPWVTFTDSEIAHVGLSEAAAAARRYRVALLPMAEVSRAIVALQTGGFRPAGRGGEG